jgi:hypothetical protein
MKDVVLQLISSIYDLYKKSAEDPHSNFATVNLKMCNAIQEMVKQYADKYR